MVKTESTLQNAPHYSGHETFPLRQTWLKKVVDLANSEDRIAKRVFTDDDAIARFGVGKNMVSSIRHWALACAIMVEDRTVGDYVLKQHAKDIFTNGGWDPYAENQSTAWYVHWQLAGIGERSTTWYWLFNHVASANFSKHDLEQSLISFAGSLEQSKKIAPSTLARDIDTCLRSYAPRSVASSIEDLTEPLLGELAIVREDQKGIFSFQRGPKPTLSDSLFVWAMLDFWTRHHNESSVLSFDSISYGKGSPGQVFKLDEDSIADRLLRLEAVTNGRLAWTDAAGLRQVHRRGHNLSNFKGEMLAAAYE